MARKQKVIHINSNVKGKLPTGSTESVIDYGEIAVNYNATEPFLSILKEGKSGTSSTDFAKFSADEVLEKVFDEKYVTIEDLEDNEEVIASALTTLNDRIDEIESKQGVNIGNSKGESSLLQKVEVETFVDENTDSPTNGKEIPTEASGNHSVVLNGKSNASAKRALAHGNRTIAQGENSHTEGHCTQTVCIDEVTNGYAAHAEGYASMAGGTYSHAEGNRTKTAAPNSHAEGYLSITTPEAESSHAEGYETSTEAPASHTEGNNTKTHKAYSHAEGRQTETFGEASHTEGNETITEGDYAHAEGWMTRAKGAYSHAEGQYTFTYADAAHSEGNNTHAQAPFSHAEGLGTKTNPDIIGQHVEGYYNAESDGVKVIGCGTADDARMNAVEVKQDGRVFVKGLGNFDGTNSNEAADLTHVIDTKADKNDVYGRGHLDNLFNTKANKDDVYGKSEVNNLLTSKENINRKVQIISSESTTHEYPSAKAVYDYAAPTSHNHDDRYYTESEIDNKFDDVASRYGFGNILVGDKTVTADISVDTLILKGENGITLTPELDTDTITIAIESDKFAPKSHTHTKSEITDFAHNHDDRYYTESEIDAKISGITAASLGLSAALKYCGITTTELVDGSTTNPVVIGGNNHTAEQGCVVFYEDSGNTKEFVFNGTKWELLGSDLTYKVVQTAVSSPNASGSAMAFIDTISQDANGVITATKKNVDMPIVKGDAENSAVLDGEYEGYSNKAISQTSMAVGAATTAGLKGWYYSKIEFGSTPIITLSDKQPSVTLGHLSGGAWSSGTPNIKVGDKISIVNNSKYDYCGEVKSISNNKVTLKSALPFDKLDTGLISLNNPDDWSIYLPDNESAGIIDFGGGALSEGVNTKATNIGSHAEGIQTHAYGQYSHTEGFKTTAGYAAHAEGKENIASGQGSHAEGQDNTSAGNVSHTEGRGNHAQSSRGHAEGENNYVGDTDRDIPEATNTSNKGFAAHVEGQANTVIGNSAHAEGLQNKASGLASHAEGQNNTSIGSASHTEGRGNHAQSSRGHAEGENNYVGDTDRDIPTPTNVSNKGFAAHAEGQANTVIGNSAHAEGLQNKASGDGSHAEGYITTAKGNYSHAEGESTIANGQAAHTEGKGTSTGYALDGTTYVGTNSHAEGENTIAARGSHAEGIDTKAYGWQSHAEGKNTVASANFAHTEGEGTKASASRTHAEGYNTKAISQAAHSEGINTIAGKSVDENGNIVKPTVSTTTTEGYYSHAEGNGTLAYGNSSHAEGKGTIASGPHSHAEGYSTKASGHNSHAEGDNTEASGPDSHAEGYNTKASGYQSHAEGYNTKASGYCSHAEGYCTTASGSDSHAEGDSTIANNDVEHASGKYNVSIPKTADNTTADATHFSIGIGTSNLDRKNAFEVKQNGDIYIEGVEGKIQDKLNVATLDCTLIGTNVTINKEDITSDMLGGLTFDDFYQKVRDSKKLLFKLSFGFIDAFIEPNYIGVVPDGSGLMFVTDFLDKRNANGEEKKSIVRMSVSISDDGIGVESEDINFVNEDDLNALMGEIDSLVFDVTNIELNSDTINLSISEIETCFGEDREYSAIYEDIRNGRKVVLKAQTLLYYPNSSVFYGESYIFSYHNLPSFTDSTLMNKVIHVSFTDNGCLISNNNIAVSTTGHTHENYLTKVVLSNSYTSTGHTTSSHATNKVYLNSIDKNGESVETYVKIEGKGNITVGSTTAGVLEISGTSSDTKNTAGATSTNDKIYLVGAKSQGAEEVTYSNSNVYVIDSTLTCGYKANIEALTVKNGLSVESGESFIIGGLLVGEGGLTVTDGATITGGLTIDGEQVPTTSLITELDEKIDNVKNELETSGTVHNAERIGGLTINEIVEQLGTGSGSGSGDGGNFSPTYKESTSSVPLIAYELNKAVYSDVMMTKNQVWAPGGFFQKSDERLKNFVEDIEVDLDKIALLPKKYFYWKDDVNGGKQIGTSAQAVKELYPEMVSEGEDGLLNVDYDKLIVVALKAIDILNEERKQMKSDIQQIKDKLGL